MSLDQASALTQNKENTLNPSDQGGDLPPLSRSASSPIPSPNHQNLSTLIGGDQNQTHTTTNTNHNLLQPLNLSSVGLSQPSTLSPNSPMSGDDSSVSSTNKRISFGKVYGGKGEELQMQGVNHEVTTTGTGTENKSNNPANHNNNNNVDSKPSTPTSPNLGGRSRHPSTGSGSGDLKDKDKSVRVTRKVFNTWRSVCGKKTKDLFKRWKAVPEDKENSIGSDSREDDDRPGSGSASGRTTPFHFRSGSVTPSGVGTSTVDKLKMLVKKHSQVEILPGGDEPKASNKWTVHVWATYVQRGEEDEEEEDKPLGREYLSDFQKTKLTHFFSHVLDMNNDNVISAADFVALNQRIRHYIDWSSDCIEFHIMKEVHSGFLECFLNQPLDEGSIMYYCERDKETREHVDINEWLDLWGELLHGKMVLENLPLWLQYFPKIIFQVINRSGSGTISREELRAFYTSFMGIDFRVVNDTLDTIYNAMTDKGSTKITYTLFKLCFSNFLFGKYPHGPGQYLFGICSQESIDCPFPIDYSAMNTPKDDLELYSLGGKDKGSNNSNRRSVIV